MTVEDALWAAVRANPDDYGAWGVLSDWYRDQGDDERANAVAGRCFVIGPHEVEIVNLFSQRPGRNEVAKWVPYGGAQEIKRLMAFVGLQGRVAVLGYRDWLRVWGWVWRFRKAFKVTRPHLVKCAKTIRREWVKV